MIQRHLFAKAQQLLEKFPIVAITGPRQSGKTTFSKQLKPEYSYVNLEDLTNREFAKNDPRGFLNMLTQERQLNLKICYFKVSSQY